MKKLALVALMAIVVGLAGCNTMQGLGKDLKKGGEAIENAGKK